jgi:hypothetical protein
MRLRLRWVGLLVCLATLCPAIVDASLGGTAATTVPERSESSEVLFKLAKQNSSYVVYPLDLLRLVRSLTQPSSANALRC